MADCTYLALTMGTKALPLQQKKGMNLSYFPRGCDAPATFWGRTNEQLCQQLFGLIGLHLKGQSTWKKQEFLLLPVVLKSAEGMTYVFTGYTVEVNIALVPPNPQEWTPLLSSVTRSEEQTL